MGELLVVVVLVIWAVAFASGWSKKKDTARKQPPSRTAPASAGKATPIERVPARRREEMARAEQWRAAKKQQDDAGQVHSVHMDTCDSRLESLKILYEAGILDGEEYAQRVARVKAKHNG